MNKRQYMRYQMIVTLSDICKEHEHTWVNHVAFKEAFEQLEAPLNEIRLALKLQSANTTGITRTKVNARVDLVDHLLTLAGAVFAYAHRRGDEELMHAAKFSRSVMLKIRDVAVVPICMRFYESILLRLETDDTMNKFGVNADVLDLLKQKMDRFEELITLPRQAIGYKANATKVVDEQIRKALSTIENELDMMAFQFREQEFYELYKRGRKMVGIGGKRKSGKQKESEENTQSGEEIQSGEIGMKEEVFFDWKSILDAAGIHLRSASVQSGERERRAV